MNGTTETAPPEPQLLSYPHVTRDRASGDGQPCIAETGIRITDLVSAYENGNSPTDLQDHFSNRDEPGAPIRHLSLAEVHAALAYYYDNLEALEAARAENERVAEAATRERHAAIMKHFLGT